MANRATSLAAEFRACLLRAQLEKQAYHLKRAQSFLNFIGPAAHAIGPLPQAASSQDPSWYSGLTSALEGTVNAVDTASTVLDTGRKALTQGSRAATALAGASKHLPTISATARAAAAGTDGLAAALSGPARGFVSALKASPALASSARLAAKHAPGFLPGIQQAMTGLSNSVAPISRAAAPAIRVAGYGARALLDPRVQASLFLWNAGREASGYGQGLADSLYGGENTYMKDFRAQTHGSRPYLEQYAHMAQRPLGTITDAATRALSPNEWSLLGQGLFRYGAEALGYRDDAPLRR